MSRRSVARSSTNKKEFCNLPTILKRRRTRSADVTNNENVHVDKRHRIDENQENEEKDKANTPSETDFPCHHQADCTPIVQNNFHGLTCLPTPEFHLSRRSPFPKFSWADPQEVWELMLMKESAHHRDPKMLLKHPCIQPRMRTILLEWLIEVCEVYRLHRETYYLAQDFIDRYLASQCDVPKQQLQLLGITALFIAAKMEEIYPPKLSEFSYVTDGACTEDEIQNKELAVLKALDWNLNTLTVISWLNIYLQLACAIENVQMNANNFLIPNCSSHIFMKVAQLTDLCTLDIGSLCYPYSIIAASALYHVTTENCSLSIIGVKWDDVASCVQWMNPFSQALKERNTTNFKLPHVTSGDRVHCIQTHNVDMELLEKAQEKMNALTVASNNVILVPGIVTPPDSAGKK